MARSFTLYSVPSMHQRTSGMNDLAIPRLSFSLLRPIIHECGLQHSERSSKNEAAVNLNSFISFNCFTVRDRINHRKKLLRPFWKKVEQVTVSPARTLSGKVDKTLSSGETKETLELKLSASKG